MKQRYEYKFIRINAGLFGGITKKMTYKEVIERHAEEGWRLVQIFAPSSFVLSGASTFYEIILERELAC